MASGNRMSRIVDNKQRSRRSINECSPIDINTIHQGLGNWTAYRDTDHPYPFIPLARPSTKLPIETGQSGFNDQNQHRIDGNMVCEVQNFRASHEPQWARSLCPW